MSLSAGVGSDVMGVGSGFGQVDRGRDRNSGALLELADQVLQVGGQPLLAKVCRGQIVDGAAGFDERLFGQCLERLQLLAQRHPSLAAP